MYFGIRFWRLAASSSWSSLVRDDCTAPLDTHSEGMSLERVWMDEAGAANRDVPTTKKSVAVVKALKNEEGSRIVLHSGSHPASRG